VRPPEEPATRARVGELRQQQADLRALFSAGRWREALQRAPALLGEARKVGYQPLIAEVAALHGVLLHKANDAAAAEKTLVEAFWAADASRHDEVRAQAAANLVFIVGYQQRRFDEGRRWAKTAEAILQRLGGHELLQAWVLNDLGNVYELEGDRQAAVQAQEQGLALKVKALGREHADVGVSEGNLAIALQGLGRNQEALTHVDRAVQLLEWRLGSGHPDLATQFNNRGEILNALGRYREARQSFERARIVWERELGLDHPNLAYALTGIGISYLADGTAASAIVPLERAFKIREMHEIDPSTRAETRFALARALWEAGRDRQRARILAEDARTGYVKAAALAKVTEVEGWLREHGSS
jgi:serine/threonine-protein kinase